MDNGQFMYFSSKNGFKILKYIAEGNTFIVNYQLSIVNFYRANGAINWNLYRICCHLCHSLRKSCAGGGAGGLAAGEQSAAKIGGTGSPVIFL